MARIYLCRLVRLSKKISWKNRAQSSLCQVKVQSRCVERIILTLKEFSRWRRTHKKSHLSNQKAVHKFWDSFFGNKGREDLHLCLCTVAASAIVMWQIIFPKLICSLGRDFEAIFRKLALHRFRSSSCFFHSFFYNNWWTFMVNNNKLIVWNLDRQMVRNIGHGST